MIFTIVILAVVGGITYFHYAQGFFGATFSAVIAVIAAVLAVSYHENMVQSLLAGKMSDYAHAMSMVAIFAIVYIVLRSMTDRMIPGNIRIPLILDRIGGGAMGLVAAIFTAGLLALAAQSLPFGPSVGGYVRYALEDEREVQIQPAGAHRKQDLIITEQLEEDTFTEEKASRLIIPVDDLLLAMVQRLSDNGSLAGARPLHAVHPNYADELFAQRLGVQVGAKRTALNLDGQTPQVVVPDNGVFKVEQDLVKTQVDAEIDTLHQRPVSWKKEAGQDMQLVVRVMFNKDAADNDMFARVSPGTVRLVANGQNYWPVGTLENGRLFSNKLDDYLFINVREADRGADFVFFVSSSDVATPREGDQKIQDGVFIEVKRLARVDLSGRPIGTTVPPAKEVKVERKAEVIEKRLKKTEPAKDPAADPAAPAQPGEEPKKPAMQTIREGVGERNEALQQ